MNILKKYTGLRIVALTVALSLSLFSCGDSFLEAIPETDLAYDAAFSTPAKILSQVNGLYASAKNGSLFGGRYLIYNDIRAEEFINRTTNNVTGYATYQGNQDATDTYIASFWSQGYLTINRANLFLEGLAANKSVVADSVAKQYEGEAKFIRALTYFALVQIFAKPYVLDAGASKAIPLRLKGETGLANSELQASTVAEVYAQIHKDLDEAKTLLPATYGTALLRTTRAHKNTAIGIKTKVLLAQGKYADVITEANKIVSQAAPFKSSTGAVFELARDVNVVFSNPYTASESILSFPMADTNVPGTQNQLGYYFNVGNLEYYLNRNAPGIYASTQWSATDARRTFLTQPSSTVGNFPNLTKFKGISPFTDYVPHLRYADILLSLAEAEAEAGSLTRAQALLEAVHHRSDPAFVFDTLTKASLITAILTERRIELLGEGHRSLDLMRRALPINSIGAGTQIQPTETRYLFAIPIIELQTNPSLAN